MARYSALDRAMDMSSRAAGTAQGMDRKQREPIKPEKTAGGAMSAAGGGAVAGTAVSPGYGTAAGAAIGFMGYYLS